MDFQTLLQPIFTPRMGRLRDTRMPGPSRTRTLAQVPAHLGGPPTEASLRGSFSPGGPAFVGPIYQPPTQAPADMRSLIEPPAAPRVYDLGDGLYSGGRRVSAERNPRNLMGQSAPAPKAVPATRAPQTPQAPQPVPPRPAGPQYPTSAVDENGRPVRLPSAAGRGNGKQNATRRGKRVIRTADGRVARRSKRISGL